MMKKTLLVLILLGCTQAQAGPGNFGDLVTATTLWPTVPFVATTNHLSASSNKTEVKTAQTDAILYMQSLSEGQQGEITPALRRGIEILAQLPEAQNLSQDQLIHTLAVTQLD